LLFTARVNDWIMGVQGQARATMSRRTTALVKVALSAIHTTRLDQLMAPWTGAVGAILMLHQVDPTPPRAFEPNRILRVTPGFLDLTLREVRAAGFDIVTIDALADRLEQPRPGQRPFVAITLDDAYLDNLTHALPVFQRHDAPFTLYAPTDYIDGRGELWWLVLEEALRSLDQVEVDLPHGPQRFKLQTPHQKDVAYHTIYWALRATDETAARAVVADLAGRAGVDSLALCRRLIMDWDQLRTLAQDPLATIGGHTRAHFSLAKLEAGQAEAELAGGIHRLERELRRPVRHVAFPFGDETAAGPREFDIARTFGLRTAVTTRKGVLRWEHAGRLHALPRLSLNGDFQEARYLKVLLSGVPFMLRDAVRGLTG
jgi:peptidoglycan/xylan/chitin deacetylase (PgdA/CDA1 family)